MTYAFAKHLYGGEVVDRLFNAIEYAPHTDLDWDPFSVVHDVSCGTFPSIRRRKSSRIRLTRYLGTGSEQEHVPDRLLRACGLRMREPGDYI